MEKWEWGRHVRKILEFIPARGISTSGLWLGSQGPCKERQGWAEVLFSTSLPKGLHATFLSALGPSRAPSP